MNSLGVKKQNVSDEDWLISHNKTDWTHPKWRYTQIITVIQT